MPNERSENGPSIEVETYVRQCLDDPTNKIISAFDYGDSGTGDEGNRAQLGIMSSKGKIAMLAVWRLLKKGKNVTCVEQLDFDNRFPVNFTITFDNDVWQIDDIAPTTLSNDPDINENYLLGKLNEYYQYATEYLNSWDF